MKENNKIYKTIVYVVLLTGGLFIHNFSKGQSVGHAYGSYCVGSMNVFYYAGPGGATAWYTDGTVIANNGSSIQVVWNNPTSYAYVNCTYNDGYGHYGSTSLYPIVISSSVTPSVSISTGSTNICSGSSATFTASPVNGGSSPYYTWYVGGSVVSSGYGNTFTTSSITDGQQVSCTMNSNASCITTSSVNSNVITMSVSSPQTLNVTISGNTSVCQGSGTSLSASVSNPTGTLSYQWKKNSYNVSSDNQYAPVYVLVQNTVNSGDVFSCVVSSNSCANPGTSNTLTISITQPQPFWISTSVNPISYCPGATVTFTASSSHPAYNYQWSMNGNAVPGATGSTFTTTASSVAQLQSVSVSASTSASCVSNTYATGSAQYIPFTIYSQPTVSGNLTVSSGSSTTLTANGNTPTYRWYDANGNQVYQGLQYSTPTTLTPGTYTYQVRGATNDGTCLTNPVSVTITVDYPPITYTTPYDNSTFSRSIDLSKPVGTTNGTSSTSPSGAVIYSIPIFTPPGTNGLQPTLSISYNSQAGSGITGYGWNLSGLSTISRIGKSTFHNADVSPVEYTNNDAFVLDGVRLNPITGTNGANGTIYATEVETFSKIISNTSTSSNNPDWFKVISKDGTIMEFGNSTDSRVLTNDGQSVMLWRLNKILDINGNYIEFKYDNFGRDSRIDEINYSGNASAGLAPYNKVKFAYGIRTDQSIAYEAGAWLQSRTLLKSITVTNSGALVKSYQFNYAFDNIQSLLKEVIESGSDGTSLNSTIFMYGPQTNNIQTQSTDVLTGPYDFYSGDFNADGKSDLLAAKFYPDNGEKYHSEYQILSNMHTNSAWILYIKDLMSTGNSPGDILRNKFVPDRNFLASDYDGDGRDDVLNTSSSTITISTNPSETAVSFNQVDITYTRSQDPNSGFLQYTTSSYSYPVGEYRYCPSNNFFVPGDFDGDGNRDYILALSTYPTVSYADGHPNYIYNLKGFFTSPSANIVNSEILNFSAGSIAYASMVIPIDFDGDGKDEILAVGSSGKIISIKRVAPSTGYLYQSDVVTIRTLTRDCKIYPGDFNGDRKTDLLVRNADGTWSIMYSDGKSFIPYPFNFNQTPNVTGATSDDKLVIADFNGDGKSDIAHCYNIWVNGVSNSSRFSVYYSRGGGSTSFYNQQYDYNHTLANGEFVTGDFDGDGRTDILNRSSSTAAADFISFKPFGKETLLAKVTDGLNVTSSFEYKLLTDNVGYPYFYDRSLSLDDAANKNPYNYIQVPIYAAYSISSPDGIGGTKSTTFSYQDAILNRAGKGFLGFKKITAKNSKAGTTIVIEKDINSQFAIPYLTRETTSITNTGEPIESVAYTTVFDDLSSNNLDKRCYQKVTKILSTNYLQSSASEELDTYDDYGNVISKVVNIGTPNGNSVSLVESTTSLTDYGAYNTSIPSKPVKVTTSKYRTGASSQSQITQFTYNSNGQLITQVDFSGLPKAVTTGFTYDAFGNVNSTTVSASGINNRVSNLTYDSKGRFIISKQIAAGTSISQTETYSYDDKWGKALSNTTSDCTTTQFQYDAFGRLIQKTGPLMTTNISFVWDVQGQSLFYTSIDNSAGKPDSKIWYDKLGRETKKQIAGFNNQWMTTVTAYDANGNLVSTTTPAYSGETPLTTSRTYDIYNRIKTLSSSLNTINYTYNKASGGNLQITVTDQTGQTSSKTIDACGKVISSSDKGGDLFFTYDSYGAQTEIKHGSTILVTNTYDVYGRHATLNDKNSGAVTYDYNSLGELILQTDNSGNSYQMTYDQLGRITSRQGPEGLTTYDYYSSGGCSNNNLQKITGVNQTKEYTYDNLKRIQTEKVTIDGSNYLTQYNYDVSGNLSKITYPSGVEVNNTYDNNGQLYQVTGGNPGSQTVLFNGTQVNGYGRFTNYTLGNNKTSSVTYQNGIPTRYFSSGVQDLNLSWDFATGNLLSRNDAIKGVTEAFEYDPLNRLVKSTVNGQVQTTLTYDGNSSSSEGNILSKTDAGNYVYRTDKIHAIAYISNPTNDISHIDQVVSYTPFLKPEKIVENPYEINITYDPNHERIKTELKNNNVLSETKYFFGDYEKQIDNNGSREIHYVSGGNGLCAIIVRQNGVNNFYVTYTDHLGSILTLTDLNGSIVAEQNFDAWGRKRNPGNWTFTSVPSVPAWLYRGYTGHEHLAQFNLVNMNNRLYDPVQGRMLSPDNTVSSPLKTQAYNRYSYAMNNPLAFIDPDGDNPILIAILIGGALNLAINAAQDNIHSFTDAFRYFGVGAIAGGISGIIAPGISAALVGGSFTSGLSGVAGTGFINGAISGAGAGFASGFFTTYVTGLDKGLSSQDALSYAVFGGMTGAFSGAVVSGVSGGFDALSNETNFFTGTTTADLRYGFGAHNVRAAAYNQAIPIKYVGRFEGIRVFESTITYLGSGSGSGGVTLPGMGIIVGTGAFTQMGFYGTWNLLAHEFGHVLQSRIWYVGMDGYFAIIAPESGLSATFNSYAGHNNYWTETWANYLSHNYFKSVGWDFANYPVRNISWFNKTKFILFRATNPIPKPAFYP